MNKSHRKYYAEAVGVVSLAMAWLLSGCVGLPTATAEGTIAPTATGVPTAEPQTDSDLELLFQTDCSERGDDLLPTEIDWDSGEPLYLGTGKEIMLKRIGKNIISVEYQISGGYKETLGPGSGSTVACTMEAGCFDIELTPEDELIIGRTCELPKP